jgi:ABC-type antimicrobial peptide transport system, permease component
MIDTATAAALGISPARLASRPAVFVDGIAYTVVGVYSSAQRVVTNESAMLIPETTALADFGNPQPGIGNQNEAQMVVATRIGAAQAVARQLAAAELPADPGRLVVTSPPNPQNLQSEVSGDLAGLFLILALVSLFIGAVGIANTTLVAVLERTEEIGLRRAVGARPRHIAVQFLAESTALGTLGGLIGTCIGVGTVVIFAAAKDWTAVLNPAYTLPAPLIGSVVGLLAGAYPRCARPGPARSRRSVTHEGATRERNDDAPSHRPADLLLYGPGRVYRQRAQGTGRRGEHAERGQAGAAHLGPGGAVPDGVHPVRRARPVQQRRARAERVELRPRPGVPERRGLSGRGNVPFAVSPDRRTCRSRSPGGPGDTSASPRRSSTASGLRPAPR